MSSVPSATTPISASEINKVFLGENCELSCIDAAIKGLGPDVIKNIGKALEASSGTGFSASSLSSDAALSLMRMIETCSNNNRPPEHGAPIRYDNGSRR